MPKSCSWMRTPPVFVSPFCFWCQHSKFLFLTLTLQILFRICSQKKLFVSDLDMRNFCFWCWYCRFCLGCVHGFFFCFRFGHGKFCFQLGYCSFYTQIWLLFNVKHLWGYIMFRLGKPKIIAILPPHHTIKIEPSNF